MFMIGCCTTTSQCCPSSRHIPKHHWLTPPALNSATTSLARRKLALRVRVPPAVSVLTTVKQLKYKRSIELLYSLLPDTTSDNCRAALLYSIKNSGVSHVSQSGNRPNILQSIRASFEHTKANQSSDQAHTSRSRHRLFRLLWVAHLFDVAWMNRYIPASSCRSHWRLALYLYGARGSAVRGGADCRVHLIPGSSLVSRSDLLREG